MSLNGARLRYVDESGQEVLVPAKGRTFQIGSYFSCDLILEPQAERLICEIKCDAFGRVTIHNQSTKETTIHLNDKIIHGQRSHPLLPGSRITILDRVYTWECHKVSEDVPSTPERLSPVEQAPNSCPSLKSHRPQIDKRLTVHNFRYSINSDDEGNTSIESRDHNESSSHLAEEEESLNFSTPPSTELTSCETPKVDLVEATQNKENTATPPATHQQLLQLCALSDVVITSFSPRETGVKVEKSFTCVRKPTKMGKQPAPSVTMSTPKSVYSTPKGGVLSELNDDSCSRDLVDFSTPSTSKKTKRESSMYLIDLTTPSKLRPSFKQQLPTPISVDSTDESSEGSPFVIDITKSDTPPTPSRSNLAKTPRRPAAAATPNRTPQSLMKRALLTSTKKKQIVANQEDRTPVATPKRPDLQEAPRLHLTAPRLPFSSTVTPGKVAELRKRGQAPSTTPRKRPSLHLGTPRDNKLSQIRKSLAAAKRSPTVDLGNRLKAKARRTLNSPKSGSPKSASPAPRKTTNMSLAKCSTPEKLDESSRKEDLSRTFTIMNESGDPAEEGSVLGMMAALVTGEMDESVASKILETDIKEHALAEDQPPKNLETELQSAEEKVTSARKDDVTIEEIETNNLKEAVKEQDSPEEKKCELDPKESKENSPIDADGGNLIIEDSICEEIHANIPKPMEDEAKEVPSDIKSSDPVAEAENKETNSRVETPKIRRSLRRLSVDQRAGVATTPGRRSTRRASIETSSSCKEEDSKIGTRRASCSALDSGMQAVAGTPRRKRRFTEEMGTPTRQSKRLMTPKRAVQVDESIGDMGVIVEEDNGQEDEDAPPAIVEDENYGKELPSDEPDNVNYQGLRDMLKTPKNCSTPRFKGLREMMRTPKVAASPIFGNIEELLDNSMDSTPQRHKASRSITVARVGIEEGKALEGVLKTPSARNIMVPIEPASAVLKSRGDSLAATTEYDLEMTNTTLHLDQIFDDVPSSSVANMEDTEAEINVTALSTASALDPLRESVSSEAPMSVCKRAATDVASHKNDPLTSTTYKAAMQADLELSATFATEEVEATSRPSSPGSNEMSGMQLLDQTSDSMFFEPLMVSAAESCKDVTIDETRALGQTTCPPVEMNEIDTDSNVGLTEPLVFSDDEDEREAGGAVVTPKKSEAHNEVSIAYKLEASSTSKVNATPLHLNGKEKLMPETPAMDEAKPRESDSLLEEVSLIEVDESVPGDSINATNDGKSLVIELDSSSDTEAPPARDNDRSAASELTIVESETFPLDLTEDLEEPSTSVDQKPIESGSPISEDAKTATEVPTESSDPEIEETPFEEEVAEKSISVGNENDVSAAVESKDIPVNSTADSSSIAAEEASSSIDTKEDSAAKPAVTEQPVLDALPSEEKTTTAVDCDDFPPDATQETSIVVENDLSSKVDQKSLESELPITKEDSAGEPAKEEQPVIDALPSEELAEEKTTENEESLAVESLTFPLDSTADSSVIVEEELSPKVVPKPIETKEDSAGKPAEDQPGMDALASKELSKEKTNGDEAAVDSDIFLLDSTAETSVIVEEELSPEVVPKPIDTKEDSAGKPVEEDPAVIEIKPSVEMPDEKTDAESQFVPLDSTADSSVEEQLSGEELAKEKTTGDEAAVDSDIFPLDSTAETSIIVEEEPSSKADQKPIDSLSPGKPAEEDQPVIDALPSEELAEEKTADEVVASTEELAVDATIPDAVTDDMTVESFGQDVEPKSIITKPEVGEGSLTSEVPPVEATEPEQSEVKKDDTVAEALGLDTEAEPGTSEAFSVETVKPKEDDVENDETAAEPVCLDDTEDIQNEGGSTLTKPEAEVSLPIDPKSVVEPSTFEVASVEAEVTKKDDMENEFTSEKPKSEAEQSTLDESLAEAKEPEKGDVEEVASITTPTPDCIVPETPTPNTQDVELVSPADEKALKAKASSSPSPATVEGDAFVPETPDRQDLVNSDTAPIDLAQEVPQESSIQENNIKDNATETEIVPNKNPSEDQQTNGDEAEVPGTEETSKLDEADKTQGDSVCEVESDKEETTIDQLPKDESAPIAAAEKSPLQEVGSPEEPKATDHQERNVPALEDLIVTVILDDDSTSMETTENERCVQEPASPKVVPPTEDKPDVQTPLDTSSIIEESFSEQPKEDLRKSTQESNEKEENSPNPDDFEDEVIQLDASSIVEDVAEDSVILETPKANFFVHDSEAQEVESKPTEEPTAQVTESTEVEVIPIETSSKESLEEETAPNNPPVTAEDSLAHNLDASQDDSVTEQKPEEVTTEEISGEEPITDLLESSATLEASSSEAVQAISVAEILELSTAEAPNSSQVVEDEVSLVVEAQEAAETVEPSVAAIIEEETATSDNQAETLPAHESSRDAESAKEIPHNDESTSIAAESEDKSQDQTATEVEELEETAQQISLPSLKAKEVGLDELESATKDVAKSFTETIQEEEAKDTVKNQSVTEETAAQATESITHIGEQPQPDDHHMAAKAPAQKAIQTAAVEDSDVIELSDDSESESAAAPAINQKDDRAEKPQTSEELTSDKTETVEPTPVAEADTDVEKDQKAEGKSVVEGSADEESPVSEHVPEVDASKKEPSDSEDTQNEKLAAPNVVSSESETSEILKNSGPEPSVSPKHSTMEASLPHEAEPSDKEKEELKPVKRATRKGSASVESPAEDVLEKPSRRARKPSAEVEEIKLNDIQEKPKRRAASRKPSAEVAEPMSSQIEEQKAETKEEEVLNVIPEEEPHSSRPNQDNELQKKADTHQAPQEDVLEKPRRRGRKPSEEVKSAEVTDKPKRRARKPSADVAEPLLPIQKEKETAGEPKEEEKAHSSKVNKENELQKEVESLQKQEDEAPTKPRLRGRLASAEVKDETPKTITEKGKRGGHKHPEEHIEEEKGEPQKQDDEEKLAELKKSDESKQEEEIVKSHTERPKRRGRKASAEESETTSGKKPKIDELIPEEDTPKSNQDEPPQEKPKRRARKASAEEDANSVAKKPSSEEVLQSIVEEDTKSNEAPEDVPSEGRSKRRGRKPSREEVVVSQPTDSANGNPEKPLAAVPEDETKTNLTEHNGPQKRTRKSSEFVPAAEVQEAAKEADHIERPRRRGRKPSVDIEHVAPDVPDKPRRRGRTPADPEKLPSEEEPDKKTRRPARKPSADTDTHNAEPEQHLKDIEEVAEPEPETEPEAAMATSKQLPEEEEEEPKTRRRGRKPVPAKKDTPEEAPSRRRGRKATEDEAPKTTLEEEQPKEVPADANNDVQELPADVEAETPVPAAEEKSTRRVRKASANVDEGTTAAAAAKKTATRRGRKEDALVDDAEVEEKQIDLQQVPTESVPAVVMSRSSTGALAASEDELTPRRREGRNMPRKNYDETSDEDKQRSARRARKPVASKLLVASKAPEGEATTPTKRQPAEEVHTPANTVPLPEPTTSQRREGRNVPRKNYTEAPDDDKPSTSRSRRMRNLTAKALELIVDSTPRPNTPRGRKGKAAGEDETPAKKGVTHEAAPPQPESGAEEEPTPLPPVLAKGRGTRRKADDDLVESGAAAPPPTKRGARGQPEEPEEQPEAAKPTKKNARATTRKAKVESESESEPVPAKKARGGARAKTPVEKSAPEPEEHPPAPIKKGRGGTRAKTPVVVIPDDSATEPEEELAKKPAARSRARGAKAAAVAVPEPEQPAAQDSDAASSSSTPASRGGRAKKVHFEPTQTAATAVEASAEDAPKRATRSRRK